MQCSTAPLVPLYNRSRARSQQKASFLRDRTKEKLVYGPFQIEARINQSTDISQQITLWNQMGSTGH